MGVFFVGARRFLQVPVIQNRSDDGSPIVGEPLPCRGGRVAAGFAGANDQHHGACYARQDSRIGRLKHGRRVDENSVELFMEALEKPWETRRVEKMRNAAGSVSRRQDIQARLRCDANRL